MILRYKQLQSLRFDGESQSNDLGHGGRRGQPRISTFGERTVKALAFDSGGLAILAMPRACTTGARPSAAREVHDLLPMRP
jgi:hypothetical protein